MNSEGAPKKNESRFDRLRKVLDGAELTEKEKEEIEEMKVRDGQRPLKDIEYVRRDARKNENLHKHRTDE